MSKLFEVQSGVSKPDVAARARDNKRRRYKYPLDQMMVGDFFFYPGANARSVSSYISRVAKEVEGAFSTRTVWMVRHEGAWLPSKPTPEATQGVGVWRDA